MKKIYIQCPNHSHMWVLKDYLLTTGKRILHFPVCGCGVRTQELNKLQCKEVK